MIKGTNKSIENEAKEQKEELLGVLLDTLHGSLLGNQLAGKSVHAREGVIPAGEETILAG